MRAKRTILTSIFLFIFVVLIALPGVGKTAVTSGDAAYPQWRASQADDDCDGPTDGDENRWYEADFDASSWQLVTPPMTDDIPPGQDRYYRTVYTPPAGQNIYLNIASDDGIEVYINENGTDPYYYDSGVDCHAGGCTGDVPWACSPLDPWVSLDITSHLNLGQPNTIAVHVSNFDVAGSGSYFWLSFNVEQLSFNLPIEYIGRDVKWRELYYTTLQSHLTAVFDHSASADDTLQTFLGSQFDNPEGKNDCQVGVNCFDGNLAYEFGTNDFYNRRVYPVADGTIVPTKSGCLTGDDYDCRVCVSHGSSGYSTLYYHLQSDTLLTSGTVTETVKIGDMQASDDGPMDYHMGLVTFYDLSEDCSPGTEVDPSGWALATTVDPHETATGNISLPLWYYPHLSSTIYDPGVENRLVWQQKKENDKNTKLILPTDMYTETLRLSTSVSAEPSFPSDLAGTGNTFYLYAIDESGDAVDAVNNPFEINIKYDDTLPDNVWADSLAIHQFDSSTDEWISLTTSIITATNMYTAETSAVAPFALLGDRIFSLDLIADGGGSISADPAEPYRYQDVVTLTATADPKWVFAGWVGDITKSTNPVTVTIESSMEITGTFNQVLFDVNVTEVGNGSVDFDPSSQVGYGQVVTLTATTEAGWYFSGWSGDLTGDDNPAVITVEADQDITATFVQYGSITIKKETDPAGGSGFTFSGDLGDFGLNDNGSQTFNNLEIGDYDVTESVPAGWRFVDVSCTGGDSTSIINGVRVSLDSGEAITCTFNNSQKGAITIGNLTKPDLGIWFAYTGDFGNFSLKDGLTQLFSNLEVDTYDVIQTEDSFWELLDVECSGGDTTEIQGGIRIDLDPGQAVTCNFLNQPKNGIYLPLMIVDN